MRKPKIELDGFFWDAASLKAALDGGPGSGNFGHEGRPGQRGGSGGGGGGGSSTSSMKITPTWNKGFQYSVKEAWSDEDANETFIYSANKMPEGTKMMIPGDKPGGTETPITNTTLTKKGGSWVAKNGDEYSSEEICSELRVGQRRHQPNTIPYFEYGR